MQKRSILKFKSKFDLTKESKFKFVDKFYPQTKRQKDLKFSLISYQI